MYLAYVLLARVCVCVLCVCLRALYEQPSHRQRDRECEQQPDYVAMAEYSRCRLKKLLQPQRLSSATGQPLILIIFERSSISICHHHAPGQANIKTEVEKETLIEFTRLRMISNAMKLRCDVSVVQMDSSRVHFCANIQEKFR